MPLKITTRSQKSVSRLYAIRISKNHFFSMIKHKKYFQTYPDIVLTQIGTTPRNDGNVASKGGWQKLTYRWEDNRVD